MQDNSDKMADVDRLEKLVLKMADDNAKIIAALAANPARQQLPVQNDTAIRSEKFAKLIFNLRKTSKIKDFKESQDSTVENWLKRFDQEVVQLKKISGIVADLTLQSI